MATSYKMQSVINWWKFFSFFLMLIFCGRGRKNVCWWRFDSYRYYLSLCCFLRILHVPRSSTLLSSTSKTTFSGNSPITQAILWKGNRLLAVSPTPLGLPTFPPLLNFFSRLVRTGRSGQFLYTIFVFHFLPWFPFPSFLSLHTLQHIGVAEAVRAQGESTFARKIFYPPQTPPHGDSFPHNKKPPFPLTVDRNWWNSDSSLEPDGYSGKLPGRRVQLFFSFFSSPFSIVLLSTPSPSRRELRGLRGMIANPP